VVIVLHTGPEVVRDVYVDLQVREKYEPLATFSLATYYLCFASGAET
jgi:hypothetical protein